MTHSKNTVLSINVAKQMTQLRSRFFNTDRYQNLSSQFNQLLSRRRADLAENIVNEARGLVVLGNSGTGKSTAIKRLFEKHSDIKMLKDEEVEADVVSLSIPSPATPKHVGLAVLNALGYPLRRDRTAGIIWELVHQHLRERKVLFLHLDEAQDFYSNRNKSDQQSVINTLKSLMQNHTWPVGVILSGMPAILDLVNQDRQLARRMSPVHFYPLDRVTDIQMVKAALGQYAQTVHLELDQELQTEQFLGRLVHACVHEFGVMVELITDAIECCLMRAKTILTTQHFVMAFSMRSGCVDGVNPFVADDYQCLDTHLLLSHLQQDNQFAGYLK